MQPLVNTNMSRPTSPVPGETRPLSVPLADKLTLTVSRPDGQGLSTVQIHADQTQLLELAIEVTERGPRLSIRAAAVDMLTDRISIGCQEFSVHARDRVSITSDGDVVTRAGGRIDTLGDSVALTADRGSFVVRANDDVQLLGEQLLLNCERPTPPPSWMPRITGQRPPAANPVPLSAVSGDASLLHDILNGQVPRE